ncbi:MAG: rhodanese-like domain-containing protein [Gemmatimonadaceae bacterium]
MLLRRFYDSQLAQASYMIGCAATGEAIVVDPNRDVEQYVRAAAEEGLRVSHVTETHIHADFVSGSRELAARTGAQLLLSGEGGKHWQYEFAAGANATLLHDGDRFMVGNIRFDVMHTPGHTPEHLSFLVTDTAATDRPMGAITGDFIFVGDVGRPDLLERAAKVAGTMRDGARSLFRSLQRFKTLPDYLQLWPGHGAGSACGKALGAVPSSTLGYERLANWALTVADEDEFVDAVLAGQPDPPKYFAEMKRINRAGPPILGGSRAPARLGASELARLLAERALVVDTRSATEYARRHVPGTINIPLNKSFTTWAGWLVPYDRDFHVITSSSSAGTIEEIAHDLSLIGLDRIAGHFELGVVDEWSRSARALGAVPRVTGAELATRIGRGKLAVIDVRGGAEWMEGHIPGVANIPLGYLTDRVDEIPRDRPVVVHCQSGSRSAIAASVLRANGFADVIDFAGGFADWQAAGGAVERAE